MFLLDCEARRLTPAPANFTASNSPFLCAGVRPIGIHAVHELTAHHIRRYLISVSRHNLSSQYQHNIARAIRVPLIIVCATN